MFLSRTNERINVQQAVAANGNQLLADLDALLQSIERAGPYLGQEGVAHAKDIGMESQKHVLAIATCVRREPFYPLAPLTNCTANDIRRQIEAAEAYASTISDPVRKQQILQSIERAKQLSPKLIEAIRAVLANPNGISWLTMIIMLNRLQMQQLSKGLWTLLMKLKLSAPPLPKSHNLRLKKSR